MTLPTRLTFHSFILQFFIFVSNTGTGTVQQAMRDSTILGYEAKEKLSHGEELDETLVANIVLEKLNSPEIKNYGN